MTERMWEPGLRRRAARVCGPLACGWRRSAAQRWINLDGQHYTPSSVVPGDVYSAAVESAASLAASAAVEERGQFAVGVNNTTDFLRPMRDGWAEVVAEPILQSKSKQL